MRNINDCPCFECVCVPICKYKSDQDLFRDCRLIAKYCTFNTLEKELQVIDKILGTEFYSAFIA